ncbi:MAG: transglycosylase domain-containing protein, partial [Bacteroidota bacterium]|nr:transglycosylase domain-containing protein [Bacteroidota bacterium]
MKDFRYYWEKIDKRKALRWTKYIGICLGAFMIIAVILAFSLRNQLLGKAVGYVEQKVKNTYGWDLKITEYRLKGWNRLEMHNILCTNRERDTVAFCQDVSLNFKVWPLLRGRVRFSNINANNNILNVNAIEFENDTTTRYPTDSVSKFQKIQRYLGYLEEYAATIPDDLHLQNCRLSYFDTLHTILVTIPEGDFNNGKVKGAMQLNYDGRVQSWKMDGNFDPSTLETSIDIEADALRIYNLSFIPELASARVGFQKAHFELKEYDNDEDEVLLKGKMTGEAVSIYNPRLSADTVVVDHGSLEFDLALSEDSFVVRHGSKIELNKAKADLWLNYGSKPQIVKMRLDMPFINGQDFLQSLPGGMFSEVKDMDIRGKIGYSLDFYLDLDKKDTISINSVLEGKNLSITDYGELRLNKLNSDFLYTPYNSRQSFIVGPSNPDFTPITNIHPYLPAAIITAEDPRFYYHNGFEGEAFEHSFLTDLNEGRFKRGGSTITMQLVKNVFLSHAKTIDRKLEEMLIVWFIEELDITSKKRMMEVYLNVIEWGPGIYGAGQASRFYFNKPPSQLTR